MTPKPFLSVFLLLKAFINEFFKASLPTTGAEAFAFIASVVATNFIVKTKIMKFAPHIDLLELSNINMLLVGGTIGILGAAGGALTVGLLRQYNRAMELHAHGNKK